MSTNDLTLYVYSYIPRLVEVLTKAVPEIKIHKVDVGKEDFWKKVPTDNEVAELQKAKIILCDEILLHQFYTRLPNIEWAQLSYAGVDRFIASAKKHGKPSFPVTRCSSFNQQMAEYVLTWIINHERRFLEIPELQITKEWKKFKASFSMHIPSLADLTVAVFGVGEVGKAIVRSLKYFNCKVYGYGRSESPPEGLQLDGYWSGDGLSEILRDCDYIVTVLPGTPQTKNLLGGDILKNAKKKPVLINLGRGAVIKESDILKALDNEWLSGAILDVFEVEPLPESSPLWAHPKVTVTPHIAAVPRAEDIARTFKENYEKYLKKQPLLYQIDWEHGY